MEDKAMLDGMEVFEKLGLEKDKMFEIYRDVSLKLDGIPMGAVLVLLISVIKQVVEEISDETTRNDFIKYLLENIKGDVHE